MRTRSLGIFVFALGLSSGVAASCAKPADEHSVLQADDLKTIDLGIEFNPNEIVDLGSLTDALTIDVSQVQDFLTKTPYDRASFLSTYTSNGVRASDAIARAATRYGINPLAFIVRAEMDQGLIGEEFYPSPPSRVEYVFGCGCSIDETCDATLAGFDRQVDCFASTLRASLDEISTNGQTAGHWAPGQASITLDGQKVTPADASTAALYQYTPVVGLQKSGGNWLFWNLWQKYSLPLGYSGGTPGGGPQGGWIGDACTADPNCTVPKGLCVTSFPQGICTTTCTTDCPTDSAHGPSFCADFPNQGGYCLAVCNPGAPACRSGYSCVNVAKFGDKTQTQSVCLPKTG